MLLQELAQRPSMVGAGEIGVDAESERGARIAREMPEVDVRQGPDVMEVLDGARDEPATTQIRAPSWARPSRAASWVGSPLNAFFTAARIWATFGAMM